MSTNSIFHYFYFLSFNFLFENSIKYEKQNTFLNNLSLLLNELSKLYFGRVIIDSSYLLINILKLVRTFFFEFSNI